MGPLSTTDRDLFDSDLGAAVNLLSTSTTPKTNKAKQKIFDLWTDFARSLGQDPSLRTVSGQEPRLAYLLVFGLRYRRKGQTDNPVRADTVASALQAVGEGISRLGYSDPRLERGTSKLHPLLASFLKALRDEDSPSTQAYPVNITILRHLIECTDLHHIRDGPLNQHTIDLIIVGFFWLLRPGEYLKGSGDPGRSTPFRLQDITFNIDGIIYAALQAPLNDSTSLNRIRSTSLTFDDQKNAVRGEVITHLPTDDPFFCPCKALGRIVQRFQQAGITDGKTPIHRVPTGPTKHVTPVHVTNLLRGSAVALEETTGIDPALISSRSLRPGGATALLCAGIDTDHIQLLGRWKSDAMFRYLRIQGTMHANRYSSRMLEHGSFTFQPAALQQTGLPIQAPAAMHAALNLNVERATPAAVLAHDEMCDDSD